MPSKYDKPLAVSRGKRFVDMTPAEKVLWVFKVVACVMTLGFVFPNVQND